MTRSLLLKWRQLAAVSSRSFVAATYTTDLPMVEERNANTHTHAHAHTLLGYLIGLSGVCHGGSPAGLDNVVGLMSAWLLICPPGHGGFRALHDLWVVEVRIATLRCENNEH